MSKSTRTADLLKVLRQKAPSTYAPAVKRNPIVSRLRPSVRRSDDSARPRLKTAHVRAPLPPPIRGKAIQFYLHAPDEKLIRELAVWLAPHRKRINDSLVIKTVLRAAKTGPDLLAAYDAAVKVDGRTRRTHPDPRKNSR